MKPIRLVNKGSILVLENGAKKLFYYYNASTIYFHYKKDIDQWILHMQTTGAKQTFYAKHGREYVYSFSGTKMIHYIDNAAMDMLVTWCNPNEQDDRDETFLLTQELTIVDVTEKKLNIVAQEMKKACNEIMEIQNRVRC